MFKIKKIFFVNKHYIIIHKWSLLRHFQFVELQLQFKFQMANFAMPNNINLDSKIPFRVKYSCKQILKNIWVNKKAKINIYKNYFSLNQHRNKQLL